MKQRFGKLFILIPIGLCWISTFLAISHFKTMPDFMLGSLMGAGIGLMILPFILKRIRPAAY